MKSKKYYAADASPEEILENVMRDFGNRLTELRNKHGCTQPEMMCKFAESTPKSTSGYSRWENGQSNPDIGFFVQLHEVWGIDLNWLLAGDPEPCPELPVEVQKAILTLEGYRRNCVFSK